MAVTHKVANASTVSASHPLRPAGQASSILLPVAMLHPIIRVAHRMAGPLNIASRIIFDHEIVIIVRGEGELLLPDGPHRFGPRHLLLIPPFLAHEFTSRGMCEHIAIHFDLAPDVPKGSDAPSGRRPYRVRLSHGLELPLHVTMLENDPIQRAVERALERWRSGDTLDQVHASADLLQAIVLLLQRQRTGRASPQQARAQFHMDKAMRHISAHYRTIRSAAEIAQAAGISTSQLNRLARSWTGHSAMELLRRARVDQARRLLATGELSIKEVAVACGFASPYHFSKVFRRIDGLPPSQYQASMMKTR